MKLRTDITIHPFLQLMFSLFIFYSCSNAVDAVILRDHNVINVLTASSKILGGYAIHVWGKYIPETFT